MIPEAILRSSWDHLAAMLGPLGAIFGHLGAILDHLGAILWFCFKKLALDTEKVEFIAPPWAILGQSWAHHGPISGPSRSHLGAMSGNLGASLSNISREKTIQQNMHGA